MKIEKEEEEHDQTKENERDERRLAKERQGSDGLGEGMAESKEEGIEKNQLPRKRKTELK